jgi:nucleoside phosphorylase
LIDVFKKYEACLEIMSRKLPERELTSFNVLRMRLIENLSHARLFGDTPAKQSDRAMILNTLDALAVSELGITFDRLAPKPAATGTTALDLLIYVALGEEFLLALDQIGKGLISEDVPELAVKAYRGTLLTGRQRTACKVAVIPAGAMGNTRSSGVVSGVLAYYKARNIVALGIAGSIGDDLEPGDVFIPQSVSEYMANAAATGVHQPTFEPSPNRMAIDPQLLGRVQTFKADHRQSARRWHDDMDRGWQALVPRAMLNRLKRTGVALRGYTKVIAGDDRVLGSGPAVLKGAAFAKWIRMAVRKTEAVEMESAGVLDAANIRTLPPKALVIRGISDFGDDRKRLIEDQTRGAFRHLAINGATSFLIRLIKAGVFSGSE